MYVQYNTWIDCQAYINRIEVTVLNFCREHFPERVGKQGEKEVLLSINLDGLVDPNAIATEIWDIPRETIDGNFCALKPIQSSVGQIPIGLFDALIEDGIEVESYNPAPKKQARG